MKTFQTWLVCIAFIVAGCFLGSLFSNPSTAKADNAPPLFNSSSLELPLNVEIASNGKVNVQNALNRTVTVQNSMPRVVYKWRTHIRYRYHTVYLNNSMMVSCKRTHQYDSVAHRSIRDTSNNIVPYLISKVDTTKSTTGWQ